MRTEFLDTQGRAVSLATHWAIDFDPEYADDHYDEPWCYWITFRHRDTGEDTIVRYDCRPEAALEGIDDFMGLADAEFSDPKAVDEYERVERMVTERRYKAAADARLERATQALVDHAIENAELAEAPGEWLRDIFREAARRALKAADNG